MFTTPFAFMAAPAGGGWTPADFTNLYEWWVSDSGVAVTSGQVDSWTGYNGKTFLPFAVSGSGYPPGYKANYIASDPNWGNQPSIELNPDNTYVTDSGYYYNIGSTSTISNKTMIGVTRVLNRNIADSPLLNYGLGSGNNNRMTIFGKGVGTDYYIYQAPNIASTGTTWNDNTYQFLRMSYDNSTGITDFYISNANTFSTYVGSITTSSGYQFGDTISFGSYNAVYGYTSEGTWVEVVVIDGIPSAGELTDYENYLTSKYGI